MIVFVYLKVSLCVRCLNSLKCNLPSFCTPHVGVEKVSFELGTSKNNDELFKKNFQSCQFVLPEIVEAEIPQNGTVRIRIDYLHIHE